MNSSSHVRLRPAMPDETMNAIRSEPAGDRDTAVVAGLRTEDRDPAVVAGLRTHLDAQRVPPWGADRPFHQALNKRTNSLGAKGTYSDIRRSEHSRQSSA